MKRSVLGRGISALLSDNVPEITEQPGYFLCPIEDIMPTTQPRQVFEAEKIVELSQSIKAHGLIQPLIVRKNGEKYLLIAGERRWRAAKLTGLTEVPVILKDSSAEYAYELSLIENIQREALNPIEEAQAYERLIELCHYTQEELAAKLGKDRSTIANSLRLLKLEGPIQSYLVERKISNGHARAILAIDDSRERIKIAEMVVYKGLNVRETEASVKNIKEKRRETLPLNSVKSFDHQAGYFSALAEKLQATLGTKVKIHNKGKKGKIEIEYYSFEDLERILGFFE